MQEPESLRTAQARDAAYLRCRGYRQRAPLGCTSARFRDRGGAPELRGRGAMAALVVLCLLLQAVSWPLIWASGEEFWPGQSATDILLGAASRRR